MGEATLELGGKSGREEVEEAFQTGMQQDGRLACCWAGVAAGAEGLHGAV